MKIEVLKGGDRLNIEVTAAPYVQVSKLVDLHGGSGVLVDGAPASEWLAANAPKVEAPKRAARAKSKRNSKKKGGKR